MPAFDYRQAKLDGVPDEQIASFIDQQRSKGIDLYIPKEQYQTKTQVNQPLIGEKGIKGTVKGIFKGGISTLTGVSSLGERLLRGTVGRMIGQQPIGQGKTSAEQLIPEQLRTPYGLEEKIGFGAEQIGELFIPAGVSSKIQGAVRGTKIFSNLPKIAKLAGIGARAGTEAGLVGGQIALQEGKINKKVKTSAIIAGALPIATGVAGSMLEGFGKKIGQSVIKPSIADIKDGFKIDNVYKHNLGGSLQQTLRKSGETLNSLSKELRTKLKGTNIPINLNEIYVKTAKRLLGDKPSIFGDIGGIKRTLNALGGEIKQTAGDTGVIDLMGAQAIKQSAGLKGSWVFGMADKDAKSVEKVYTTFYQELKKAIENTAPSGVKEINKKMSEIIPILHATLRRIPVAERSNAIDLLGGIGLLTSVFDPRALVITGLNILSKSGMVGKTLVKTGSIIQKDPRFITSPLLNKMRLK